MKKIFLLFIFITAFIYPQNLTIEELEREVNSAESMRNVSARSHVHFYWQLADLYLEANDYINAYRVIINGLRLDPWNFKYQYLAAEIEMMNGDYVRANDRLNFLINNLRDLSAIYENSRNQRELIPIDALNDLKLSLPNHYLYIATYPGIDRGMVDLIAARVAEEFGIEVRIINAGIAESELNMRDRQLEVYTNIVNDVVSRYPRATVDNFIEQLGLTWRDLESKEGMRIFSYALYAGTEEGLEAWREIEAIRSQYDASALMNQLSLRYRNFINDPYCLGVLGITSEDIYTDDYNFLFGLGRQSIGVMSYARFTLDYPSQMQIEKRAVMQAFSSAGIIIGIPRCTQPDCARAYPNSLAEHDRKEETLCEECRHNLRVLYARMQ